MSTYGDRGNIICLTKRCQWRGIDVEVKNVTLGTLNSELSDCDLLFMGGAQDRQQKIVAKDFLGKKAKLVKTMIDDGLPALFVCAAYQFVGHYYRPYQGADIPGAGIFDLFTVHPGDQAKRLIGNVVAKLLDFDQTIVGFENHGGRTTLGSQMKPLAKVITGFGNNSEDGFEGATYKNALGSYFHGPLLPKNPFLADWLIQKALEVKYNKSITLAPLNDSLEKQAHDFVVKKYGH
ncbi:cobalamin biosynthesis protein CobQ [Candidatus Microgenomates bacterium]|nr:cobalamin biosynthesis protein CobQ [Candidatus Microgenomates bacterium]